MRDAIAINARYWEHLAPHRPGCSLEEIRSGTVLDAIERTALGELAGRTCLQVAASVGDEALHMALMGATVTAVDLAPSHVATGRGKAEELGVSVGFRVGDMTALDDDLRGFDVIYISWGGLCWVPDLGSWMRDMAGRLAAGGRIVIAEHHPLWEILTVTDDGRLTATRSYFDPGLEVEYDVEKAPQIVKDLKMPDDLESRSFVWGLGAVVSAMLNSGLVLTGLQESPDANLYPGFAGGERLPATYVAVGVKA